MKKLILYLAFAFVLSCSDDSSPSENNSDSNNPTNNIENAFVSGFAQKGPFLNGSSIILSELDENFNPTGLNYSTQIIDNSPVGKI